MTDKFKNIPKEDLVPGVEADEHNMLHAEAWNQVMYEILNIIESAGITPSSEDVKQVMKSVMNYGATASYYTDESTDRNEYILNKTGSDFVAPTQLFNGLLVNFIPNLSNLNSSSLNLCGLGAKPIYKNINKQLLDTSDIEAGKITKLIYLGGSFDGFLLNFIEPAVILPDNYLNGFLVEAFKFSIKNTNNIIHEATDFYLNKDITKSWNESTDYNNTTLKPDYRDDLPAMTSNDDGVNKCFATTQNSGSNAPYFAFDKSLTSNEYLTSNNWSIIQGIGRNNPGRKKIKGFKFTQKSGTQQYRHITFVGVYITDDDVAPGINPNLFTNYNWSPLGSFKLEYDNNGVATVNLQDSFETNNIVFRMFSKIGFNDSIGGFSQISLLREEEVPACTLPRGGRAIEPEFAWFNELAPMTSNYGSDNSPLSRTAAATSQYSSSFAPYCVTNFLEAGWTSNTDATPQMVTINNPSLKLVNGIRLCRGKNNNYATRVKILATNDPVISGINANLKTDYTWTDLGEFDTNFLPQAWGWSDIEFTTPSNYRFYAVEILAKNVGATGAVYALSGMHLLRKNYCKYTDIDLKAPMTSNFSILESSFVMASNQESDTFAPWKAFNKNSREVNSYWRAQTSITMQGIGFSNVLMDKINFIEISREEVSNTYATRVEIFGSNYSSFTPGIIADLFTNSSYGNVSLGQFETNFTGTQNESVKIDISHITNVYKNYLIQVINRYGSVDIIEQVTLYGEKCQFDGTYKNWLFQPLHIFNINKGLGSFVFDTAADTDRYGSNILLNNEIINAGYTNLSASGRQAVVYLDYNNMIASDINIRQIYTDFWFGKGQAKSSDNTEEISTSGKVLKTDDVVIGFSLGANLSSIESSLMSFYAVNIINPYPNMTTLNAPSELTAFANGSYDGTNIPWKVRSGISTNYWNSQNSSQLPAILFINNPSLFHVAGIELIAPQTYFSRMPVKFDIIASNEDLNSIYTDSNGNCPQDSFDLDKFHYDVIGSFDNQTWTASEKRAFAVNSDFQTKYKWYGIKVYNSNDVNYVAVSGFNLLTVINKPNDLYYTFVVKNIDNEDVNFVSSVDKNASNNIPLLNTLGYTKLRNIGGLRYNKYGEYSNNYAASIKIDSGGDGMSEEFYYHLSPNFQARYTISSGFTAPTSGIVIFELQCMNVSRSASGYINGIKTNQLYYTSGADHGYMSTSTYYGLKIGDIITFDGVSNAVFVPYNK